MKSSYVTAIKWLLISAVISVFLALHYRLTTCSEAVELLLFLHRTETDAADAVWVGDGDKYQDAIAQIKRLEPQALEQGKACTGQ